MPTKPSYLATAQHLSPRVLTFKQWIEKNGLSDRTGRRILKSGNGPKITRLSERRVGIRTDHDLAWLESCARDKSEGEAV